MDMRRFLIPTLLLMILLLGAVSVYQHMELRDAQSRLEEAMNDYNRLMREHADLERFLNLTTYMGSIRGSYALHIIKVETDCRYRLAVAIYCLKPNSTLRLDLWSIFPEGKVYAPIAVQRGNAFKRDEATDTWQISVYGTMENISVAPVIFYVNATDVGCYEVPLDEGWYTISIGCPVGFSNGTGIVYGVPIPFPYIYHLNETARILLDIKIYHDGNRIPFLVSEYTFQSHH